MRLRFGAVNFTWLWGRDSTHRKNLNGPPLLSSPQTASVSWLAAVMKWFTEKNFRTWTQALLVSCALLLGSTARASFINYSSREINIKIVYHGASTVGLLENRKPSVHLQQGRPEFEGQDDLTDYRDRSNCVL
jgi:hypothetical protein